MRLDLLERTSSQVWAEVLRTTPPQDASDLDAILQRWPVLLLYDADTGLLYWRAKVENQMATVDPNVASCVATYRMGPKRTTTMVMVDKFRLPAADVVWLLHKGAWPPTALGRVDGDPTNDRIENLELAVEKPKAVAKKALKPAKTWINGTFGCFKAWGAYRGATNPLGEFPTTEDALAACTRFLREAESGDLV